MIREQVTLCARQAERYSLFLKIRCARASWVALSPPGSAFLSCTMQETEADMLSVGGHMGSCGQCRGGACSVRDGT
jgi:hypothetical protein